MFYNHIRLIFNISQTCFIFFSFEFNFSLHELEFFFCFCFLFLFFVLFIFWIQNSCKHLYLPQLPVVAFTLTIIYIFLLLPCLFAVACYPFIILYNVYVYVVSLPLSSTPYIVNWRHLHACYIYIIYRKPKFFIVFRPF